MVTKAKASFSIGGYLSSAPRSARLVKYTGFCTPSSSLTKAVLTVAVKYTGFSYRHSECTLVWIQLHVIKMKGVEGLFQVVLQYAFTNMSST